MTSSSTVVGKERCPVCASQGRDTSGDNLVVYDDGHKYCYSCSHFVAGDGTEIQVEQRLPQRRLEVEGVIDAIPDRRISAATCKIFNVTQTNGKQYYPYHDADGNFKGTKVRQVKDKQFYYTGENTTALFGQHLFNAGGKYITIVEGELDCLAVSEMFDNKWPVVSLKNGAGSARKDIKANLEYLESFDQVVLCFDNDPAGQKALEEVQPLFSYGKVKVCKLPLKDASDMLKENRVREFTKAWWEAKDYKPTGVKNFSDESMWDAFVARGNEDIIPFPDSYGQLNYMMNGGIAGGEVTVIGALTSVGKSTMVYNLIYDMVMNTNKKVGVVLLEADMGEITEKMVSLHRGINISNIPYDQRDMTDIRKAYEEVAKPDKLEIYEHHGASDLEDLFSKMRYMVKADDCEVIILDPLQAAVPSNENGVIDKFMDACLKLTKETGVSLIVVSHMNKPATDKPHAVSEYNTKGSGSINQIAFNTILLSRDKLAEDEYERNLTLVKLVKCRRTGKTGECGWMWYNAETTRMEAGIAPEMHKANEIDEF